MTTYQLVQIAFGVSSSVLVILIIRALGRSLEKSNATHQKTAYERRVRESIAGTWPPKRPESEKRTRERLRERFAAAAAYRRDHQEEFDGVNFNHEDYVAAALGLSSAANGPFSGLYASTSDDFGADSIGEIGGFDFIDRLHGGIDPTGNGGLAGDFDPSHTTFSLFDSFDAFDHFCSFGSFGGFDSDSFGIGGGFVDMVHGGIDTTGMGGFAGDHNPEHEM